jgi:hypothetical protein
MPKQYFTLIEYDGEAWSPQFGDYRRSVVMQERHDRHDSHPFPMLKDLRVVKTEDDSQAAINNLVKQINDAEVAKRNQVRVS